MAEKLKTELKEIQETLLLPLWGRAVESQKADPRLTDKKAVEIIEQIDYDFSRIAKNISWISQLAWVARSLHMDRAIQNFIGRVPGAVIVNIGCGLDTTYERMANEQIRFYDLDLPEVIRLRKIFFRDHGRRKTLTGSFLDHGWVQRFDSQDPVLFIAAGVFYYFDENQIRSFFISLARHFNFCEVFFDSASPLGVRVANKKVIQDGGMDESAILKWGIKTARVIETWDPRIRRMAEFPMFRGFKKGYPLKMQYGLWMSDFLKIMSMVHLRIERGAMP
jgi:O-methyltransferase involved in polyketide biosynthesis